MDVLRVGERGQATVEAAFFIPVLFTVLLLSVQPCMVLYDRMVMQAAVSDACRLVAVKTDAAGDSSQAVEAFVRHRLGCIPPVSCFHVHEGGCSGEGSARWAVDGDGPLRTGDAARLGYGQPAGA